MDTTPACRPQHGRVVVAKGIKLAITCGQCGARNAPTATYCIQCMTSFGPLTLPKPPARLIGRPTALGAIPPPPPGLAPIPGPSATPNQTATPAPASPQPNQARAAEKPAKAAPTSDATMPSDAQIAALLSGAAIGAPTPELTLSEEEHLAARQSLNADGVGVINGKPIWQCQQCEHLQPMTNFVCAKCGTRFGEKPADPIANANFKRMEMMFPGYGFLQSGHLFAALTRIIVATSWLVMAVIIAFQRPLVALPLLVGVGVLWALGPKDVENVLLGHEPRLNGRGLLTLVSLVLLSLILVGAADFYLGTSGLNQ